MTTVLFSHGHISSPASRKIELLAPIAEQQGLATEALDYRDLQDDAPGRAQRLRERIEAEDTPPLLVGSSMGGWVSMAAAETHPVAGLFLLAPALFMEDRVPGGEVPDRYHPRTDRFVVVHGWHDDIVPWEGSLRFSRQSAAELHLLDADHRLEGALAMIGRLFEAFVRSA